MTTRREWLKQNPPPRAAAHTRALIEELEAQEKVRKQYETNKQTLTSQHVPYWNQEIANARAAGNTANLNYANGQLAQVNAQIAECDTALKNMVQVPTRLAALTKEVAAAAKCPTHSLDLSRHNNRPEDLFVCSTGPHFFIWTRVGAGGGFAAIEITKPIPGLDWPLLDGLKISRAEWLSLRPPQVQECPNHKGKTLSLVTVAKRPDVFGCPEDSAFFLWTLVAGAPAFVPLSGDPPPLDAEMKDS